MSERDDIDDLLDDLAETLEALQRELPAGELAPRPPRPRRRPSRARDVDRSRDTEPPRNDEPSRGADRSGDRDRVRDRTSGRDRNRGGDRSRRRRAPGTGEGPRRPRIPGPGEFLRFTEEYTIPTLIAMLEATVKSLELLRAVLRVAGGRGLPDPTGSGRSRRSRGREVVGDAGRRALGSLDTVLDDLQDAIDGQPTDPRARDLLGEARDLRADIDDMIAGRAPVGGDGDAGDTAAPDVDDDDAASRPGAEGRRSGGVTIDVGDSSSRTAEGASSTAEPDGNAGAADNDDDAGEDDADASVDVDAELDTIKREMGKTAGTAEGGDGQDGDDGDDVDDGAQADAQ